MGDQVTGPVGEMCMTRSDLHMCTCKLPLSVGRGRGGSEGAVTSHPWPVILRHRQPPHPTSLAPRSYCHTPPWCTHTLDTRSGHSAYNSHDWLRNRLAALAIWRLNRPHTPTATRKLTRPRDGWAHRWSLLQDPLIFPARFPSQEGITGTVDQSFALSQAF